MNIHYFYYVIFYSSIPALLFLGINQKIRGYKIIPDTTHQNYGQDYVQIRSLTEILRKQLGILKPIKIFIDPNDNTGVTTLERVVLLYVGKTDARRDDEFLVAILAHELVHVYNNDSLKRGISKVLGNMVIIYSTILAIASYFLSPLPTAMIIGGVLGLVAAVLYYLPSRVTEKTADGGAALLGFGSELKFIINQSHRLPKLFHILMPYESPWSRIKYISEILEISQNPLS